jgi:hypothetical protein
VASTIRREDRQAIIGARTRGRLMWVIYLEATVAVTVVLFVVWWTMRGKK